MRRLSINSMTAVALDESDRRDESQTFDESEMGNAIRLE
jgi:hypothetical protein